MSTERLTYSDWTDKRRLVKSQYVEGLKVDDGEDFRCPRCGWSVIKGLVHSEEYTCACLLRMVRYGNCLELLGDES